MKRNCVVLPQNEAEEIVHKKERSRRKLAVRHVVEQTPEAGTHRHPSTLFVLSSVMFGLRGK